MKLCYLISILMLTITPLHLSAAFELQAMKIGDTVPLAPGSRSIVVGEQLLFNAGDSMLYSYDGNEITRVDNPHDVILVPVGLPVASSAATTRAGVILNDEYYFVGKNLASRSLFKTDGTTINLVADIDPLIGADARVGSLIASDSHVYLSAINSDGPDLLRTNGAGLTPIGPLAATDSTEALSNTLRQVGNRILFTGRNLDSGILETYELGEDGYGLIAGTVGRDYQGSTYWIENDRLMRNDGNATSIVPTADTISSLEFWPTVGSTLTLRGLGPAGWAIYTWDGARIKEFDTDPGGIGSPPGPTHEANGAVFFLTRENSGPAGREYARISEDSLLHYDILPGPLSSEPDATTATLIGETLIFRADGPFGNELYAADETGYRLLADLNPAGDAFPFTIPPITVLGNKAFLEAYSPVTGTEIYFTDGDELKLFFETKPGSEGSVISFLWTTEGTELDLLFFRSQTFTGDLETEYFISNGESVISQNEISLNGSLGLSNPSWIEAFMGDIIYFSDDGQIIRIAIVPEPAGITLLIVGVATTCLRRRALSAIAHDFRTAAGWHS